MYRWAWLSSDAILVSESNDHATANLHSIDRSKFLRLFFKDKDCYFHD